MPGGAHAGSSWFEKNLVEMKRDFRTDQAGDGVDDLGRKREGANQRAVEIGRAELQVLFGAGSGGTVTISGDVAEKIIPFQSCDIGLERGGFFGVKEAGSGYVTVALEVSDLIRGEVHKRGTRLSYRLMHLRSKFASGR